MSSIAIDNSRVALAHHEAGHALLRFLLRGPFEDDATLTLTKFHAGAAAGRCCPGGRCLGEICGDDYCIHELWEDLAGPVAEWQFRSSNNQTEVAMFPWLLELSKSSLKRLPPDQFERDDMTRALRSYCGECLCADNTSVRTEKKAAHSNEHSLKALEREAEVVRGVITSRWNRIEAIGHALLEGSEVGLRGRELRLLLAGVLAIDGATFEQSQALREQDQNAQRPSNEEYP